ncbi:serine hydrolase domain-containing protein [Kribbella sindirgiensis]|uniref:Class A beta-lactamase-related serine hydrolase n=1 Tax=Kribbella sindirgiensis TaxID=1124744 RepID=A0A4R0ILW3_9ACTN|nr:serine hydrolase domain-containing protein [Kribbella sindirgiensis]TCC33340.1 class A beta-lactamase-related serine hydrolase [Kribbella sindirgiensis]
MARTGVAVLLVLGLVGCSGGDGQPGGPPSTPAAVSFPDPGTGALDPAKAKVLQDVLAKVVSMPDIESGARGVTAAVVTDQWSWSGAAGLDARGTKLVPTSSMAVASITKTFVASEVMLLAKAKKVDLDAPLSTYVKHKLTANNATVRQHLSMTSGVPNYLPEDYGRMDKAIAAVPSKHWTPEQALSYDTAPVGPPNSPYNYSNPSYVLLGMLIEKVTGQSLAAVLRRDLAIPAGLQHAAFQDAEKPQAPVVADANPACGAPDGYLPCRAIASLSAANAGLAADAPTVARWGYELYGGRVLPADLVADMTSGDGEYGLGTMLFSQQFGADPAYGHRGDLPDHSSLLLVIPAKKLAIAILLADGNKHVDTTMTGLLTAVGPLLS